MSVQTYSTCLQLPVTIHGMNGEQIRAGRERRGWTQAQLAQRVGVGQRTVGNWERGETVPMNRMAALRDLFAEDDASDPIRSASDIALLSELMRRAAQREGRQKSFG